MIGCAKRLSVIDQIREDIRQFGIGDHYSLTDVALKFVLAHSEVSTLIAGMRNQQQVEQNTATSDLKDLPDGLMVRLRRHNWLRGVWY